MSLYRLFILEHCASLMFGRSVKASDNQSKNIKKAFMM